MNISTKSGLFSHEANAVIVYCVYCSFSKGATVNSVEPSI